MTQSDPVTMAMSVIEMMRMGHFEQLEELFAPRLAATVSADTVRVGWNGELAKIGEIRHVGAATTEPAGGGLTRVKVPVDCENGGLVVRVAVDDEGKLHGFLLAAPEESGWTPPRYASPRKITEEEVVIGSGPHTVPGTLTLPKGPGPRPAVVLLASGAADRDLTSGPNKPFKDLAWGLAARGIAVLRFDKINYVHNRIASEPGFTMVAEYVTPGVAAVALLQRRADIDSNRVYLIGHSGGGKAAPRVAAEAPSVAGVVIMAGDTVALPQAVLRVFQYVAGLDRSRDMTATIRAAADKAKATESHDLSPTTPASHLLFGWAASYWLDLRDYDQVGTAASLGKPLLLLQGRRDYQVTVEDDWARWQAGLAGRRDVTFRLYDADDHLFFPGTAKSTPMDTQTPGHVDQQVVADIAAWMAPGNSRGPVRRLLARLTH